MSDPGAPPRSAPAAQAGSTRPQAAPAADGAPAPAALGTPFDHVGRTRELLAIGAVNLLLKVCTLGIYHFWAKTRVRRYVWSHTRFAGEAFEYSGRGLELLLGYVIAMAVLLPLIALYNALPLLAERQPLLAILGSATAYPVFVFLTGFAAFSARRYLLSRTRWRSIRFALSGRARDHGWRMLLYSLLTAVTFGLYLPFLRNRLAAHLIGNAWFGSERLHYDGPDDVLLRRYLRAGACMLGVLLAWGALIGISLPLLLNFLRGADPPPELAPLLPALIAGSVLLVFPALGAIWLWYRAGELRHFVAHTRLGTARFALELPARRYVWLYIGNVAGLLLSLGLAYPWVVVRTARTLTAALRMEGALDVAAIQQAAAGAPRTGEGLADALDLGSI